MDNESMSNEPLHGGHDIPLGPPPGVPRPGAPTPSEPRGSGGRAAAIAIAAFGAVVLLVTGGNAAVAAVHTVAAAGSDSGGIQSVNVDGIDALRIDATASTVIARFGDVEEATLEVTGSRAGEWRMDRDDDELVVRRPDDGFGWWLGGDWFDGDWFRDEETVVLTLPESLERAGLDAEFALSAGSLDIEGAYGEVDIEVGAGALTMEGSATAVDAEVNAGRADLVLADVDEAEFTVAAGKLVAEITDSAPRSVSIDVSAGSLDLTLPDEAYRLSQEVTAGSLDNRLDTSGDSRFVIDASVSAGSATLRPGD